MRRLVRVFVVSPEDGSRGDELRLNEEQQVVGVGADAALQVSAFRVAPRHAAFYLRDDEPYVVDLGTPFGTFRNFSRITRETRLREGDVVRLGPDFRLVIRLVEVEEEEEELDYSGTNDFDDTYQSVYTPSTTSDADSSALQELSALIRRCAAAKDQEALFESVLLHLEQTIPAQRIIVMLGSSTNALKVATIREPTESLYKRDPLKDIIDRSMKNDSAVISFDSRTLCASIDVPDPIGVIYVDVADARRGPYTPNHGAIVKLVAQLTGLFMARF